MMNIGVVSNYSIGKGSYECLSTITCEYENKYPLKVKEPWTKKSARKAKPVPSILEMLDWGSGGAQ